MYERGGVIMNKEEKKVNEKPYNALLFLKDFILLELVIMYIVVVIGDFVSGITELPVLLTRYIPVAIAALLTTLLIIKFKAKKCKKSEEKEVKKYMFIAPIIVAVIIVVYGFYSVSVNIKEADTKVLGLLVSQEYIEELLQAAANSARMNWIITGSTYLVAAEAIVLMKRKKIGMLLKDDFESEPMMMETNEFVSMQNDFQVPEQNNEAINNIKWDL